MGDFSRSFEVVKIALKERFVGQHRDCRGAPGHVLLRHKRGNDLSRKAAAGRRRPLDFSDDAHICARQPAEETNRRRPISCLLG